MASTSTLTATSQLVWSMGAIRLKASAARYLSSTFCWTSSHADLAKDPAFRARPRVLVWSDAVEGLGRIDRPRRSHWGDPQE